jgi:ribosomal-protein-alanine N-acetyltransferase
MPATKTYQNFKIRQMLLEDLDQVLEIEPKAFGTHHWTRENFVQELNNNMAHYLVAENTNTGLTQSPHKTAALGLGQGVCEGATGVYSSVNEDSERANNAEISQVRLSCNNQIIGYGGAWIIIDEMHITTLGVDPEQRRKNIAEAIIVEFIDLAIKSRVRGITLEVRLSNIAAQKLYEKYGFQRQGMRKRYYEDNQETALLLWTEDLQSEAFQKLYRQNIQDLNARLSPDLKS